MPTYPNIQQGSTLGQATSQEVSEARAQAAAAVVGIGIALFGSMGKKEPIMIIVGSIMAGIGGAGVISGIVRSATK